MQSSNLLASQTGREILARPKIFIDKELVRERALTSEEGALSSEQLQEDNLTGSTRRTSNVYNVTTLIDRDGSSSLFGKDCVCMFMNDLEFPRNAANEQQGRSAFEPTQDITESDAYIQLESSQAELPTRYEEATENNYIQLYDERGNPINPRSREYGKKLRNAQNDVLAAVGVVERRLSPAEALPGSYEERLSALDAEDTAGNVVALTTSLTKLLGIWWVGTIRDRLLVYADLSRMETLADESRPSGIQPPFTSHKL